MKLNRHTLSICPSCWLEIPARIEVASSGAWMVKKCPTHGETRAMVERDPIFYAHVMALAATQIYPGYFLEITRRCNIRCPACYMDLLKDDPEEDYTIGKLLNECAVNMRHAPFILTGGEPTFRKDIVEVLTEVRKISPQGIPPRMLSNGVRLTDRKLYEAVLEQLHFPEKGIFCLNFSIHHEVTDTWRIVLEMLRSDKIKIESALVAHAKVAEAAVVGMPHEIKGQGIYAFVTTNANVEPDEALRKELIQWVRHEIGPIATPDVIHFAPALPKTRSGKIMRRLLRDVAEGRPLGDTSTLLDPSVFEAIRAAKRSEEVVH